MANALHTTYYTSIQKLHNKKKTNRNGIRNVTKVECHLISSTIHFTFFLSCCFFYLVVCRSLSIKDSFCLSPRLPHIIHFLGPYTCVYESLIYSNNSIYLHKHAILYSPLSIQLLFISISHVAFRMLFHLALMSFLGFSLLFTVNANYVFRHCVQLPRYLSCWITAISE